MIETLLLAASIPPLSPDDPLFPYAQLMIDMVGGLKSASRWTLIAIVMLILSNKVFFYIVYRWRVKDMESVRKDRVQAAEDRESARLDREAAAYLRDEMRKLALENRQLLELVKGWTVASTATNAQTGITLHTANNEVKRQIEDVSHQIDVIPLKVAEEVKRQHDELTTPPEGVVKTVSVTNTSPRPGGRPPG